MNEYDQTDTGNQSSPGGRRNPFAQGAGSRPSLAELPDKLLALLRQSPAGEIEQGLKNLVNSTVAKLDLVTREEFEIQAEMIERLRARIEALEAKLEDQQK